MRKEGKSQRSLLYELREVGSQKVYILEKGHLGLTKNFVCTSCTTLDEDGMDPTKNLCNGVETVNELCYLGDKLKAS